MFNEKSRRNLKPFTSTYQPEVRGRPRGSLSVKNEIRKVLEKIDPVSKKSVAEILAEAAVKHAIKGNINFFKAVCEIAEINIKDQEPPMVQSIVVRFVRPDKSEEGNDG